MSRNIGSPSPRWRWSACCLAHGRPTAPCNTERAGGDEAAKIGLTLAEAANKQAAAAREKERRAAAELAERQTELEKERQDAEKSISAMRLELDRLRQHAARQSGRRNLPATAATAAAPDGAASAEGWELLGRCAAEYAGLAETADTQAADLREWQAYGRVVSKMADK